MRCFKLHRSPNQLRLQNAQRLLLVHNPQQDVHDADKRRRALKGAVAGKPMRLGMPGVRDAPESLRMRLREAPLEKAVINEIK